MITEPKSFKTMKEGTPVYALAKARNKGPFKRFTGLLDIRTKKYSEIAKNHFRTSHNGWYLDDYCDETAWGVVGCLSHRRFVAGVSDSYDESYAQWDRSKIYDNEKDAAIAADREAERYAEKEREYREADQKVQDAEGKLLDLQRELDDVISGARIGQLNDAINKAAEALAEAEKEFERI